MANPGGSSRSVGSGARAEQLDVRGGLATGAGVRRSIAKGWRPIAGEMLDDEQRGQRPSAAGGQFLRFGVAKRLGY